MPLFSLPTRWLALLTLLLLALPARADSPSGNFTSVYAYLQGWHWWGHSIDEKRCNWLDVSPGALCGDGYRVANAGDMVLVQGEAQVGRIAGSATVNLLADDVPRYGVGHLQSWWWDTLTVQSSTLAPGTPVTLELRIDWTRDMGTVWTDCGSLCPTATASFNYAGPDCCALLWVQDRFGTTPPPGSSTASYATVVGATVNLVGQLRLDVDSPIAKGGSAFVAASAQYYVTPPAGVSLSSASGHDYSVSAVPEPTSALLLTLGGAVLLMRRRTAAGQSRP